jgi:hypothetical protein
MAINWNLGPKGGEAMSEVSSGIDRFGASILEAMKYREQKNRQEQLDKQAREHQQFLEKNATDQLGLQKDKWAKEQDQTKMAWEDKKRSSFMNEVSPLIESGRVDEARRAAQALGIGAEEVQNDTSAAPVASIDEALKGHQGNIASPSPTYKFTYGGQQLGEYNRDQAQASFTKDADAVSLAYANTAKSPAIGANPIAPKAYEYASQAVKEFASSPSGRIMSRQELEKFADSKVKEFFSFDKEQQDRIESKARLAVAREAAAASRSARELSTQIRMGALDETAKKAIDAEAQRFVTRTIKNPEFKTQEGIRGYGEVESEIARVIANINSGTEEGKRIAQTDAQTILAKRAMANNKGALSEGDVQRTDAASPVLDYITKYRNMLDAISTGNYSPQMWEAVKGSSEGARKELERELKLAAVTSFQRLSDQVKSGRLSKDQALANGYALSQGLMGSVVDEGVISAFDQDVENAASLAPSKTITPKVGIRSMSIRQKESNSVKHSLPPGAED